ncbi:hypothetical protein AMC87_PD00762 (plasmid) [Rhizobium phaseoli]|nr:hypothetical protein AMC87_PD00762 [Rhizobium phaseoli]EGE61238.1 hypothetical protein RHECNPAF_12210052 [Rhizobium etli CNPAF512]
MLRGKAGDLGGTGRQALVGEGLFTTSFTLDGKSKLLNLSVRTGWEAGPERSCCTISQSQDSGCSAAHF